MEAYHIEAGISVSSSRSGPTQLLLSRNAHWSSLHMERHQSIGLERCEHLGFHPMTRYMFVNSPAFERMVLETWCKYVEAARAGAAISNYGGLLEGFLYFRVNRHQLGPYTTSSFAPESPAAFL